MKIIVEKGLDIPVLGKAQGSVKTLPKPKHVALNLALFETLRFRVLAKVGEKVKIGQPLLENKGVPGQFFVSPGSGTIAEIRRGAKRALIDIIIDLDAQEEYQTYSPLDPDRATKEEILERLMQGGAFPHIRLRPFNLIADPKYPPRDIFVAALESLPFNPPAEMQVEGCEDLFRKGLEALAKLTSGRVHVVHREGTLSQIFQETKNITTHTVEGPHPAANPSLHIQKIAPIQNSQDYVWTLSTLGVLTIGKLVLEGKYFIQRVVSLAGNGIRDGKREYVSIREGFPIADLIADRLIDKPLRLISGDPLTGSAVESTDFLGFHHTAFSVIPENVKRQLFHFFRLGFNKYTATRTYASGHVKPPVQGYAFTTNQHGEERPFIDSGIYNKVMPLRIPTVHLIKAILAEDFELAEKLGLLEVAPEDFALSTFICPSKIEMVEIVKEGLHRYSREMGH